MKHQIIPLNSKIKKQIYSIIETESAKHFKEKAYFI